MAATEQPPRTAVLALQPAPGPATIVLALRGRIARADIPRLCERARVLLEDREAAAVVCDVGSLIEPDAAAVDALARLQLTARRLGHEVRLRHTSQELQNLLSLAGLCRVVPSQTGSGIEPRRQIKEGEEACGVEEEIRPDDPTA